MRTRMARSVSEEIHEQLMKSVAKADPPYKSDDRYN
jgi:hypothetical protein